MKRILYFIVLTLFIVACSEKESTIKEIPNTTLESIFNRKSVRTYEDRPVEKEKLDTLVRAGMAAPSSRDRRPWEFIIVTDRDKLNTLAQGLPFAKMLTNTHQAIIVCGDTIKSDNSWFLDCSAAAQNILIAAESMGLGATWTAAFPYHDRIQIVRETLNLPDHIIPLNVIPIGYPAGDEKPKNKYNKEQIHYNEW